ncbi:hypothetical protein GPECTOR_10g902 [Gonium pectorale]|uniref:Uncharacterized protein n=1 Tax=Gonium pectorale TaxID=33097 RepID=A0A150GR32_GONPE|nr:hypothetical protein GPECTOR_10g902 [Gonium pectorale]|eukprot:KXZ52271.1 hypothetical protein GPECTOR_10g902 [Gonium pectorale]
MRAPCELGAGVVPDVWRPSQRYALKGPMDPEVARARLAAAKSLMRTDTLKRLVAKYPGIVLHQAPEVLEAQLRGLAGHMGLGDFRDAAEAYLAAPNVMRPMEYIHASADGLARVMAEHGRDADFTRQMLRSRPHLLSLQVSTFSSKMALLREVSAGYWPWEAELRDISPSKLARLMQIGTKVLMRLKYLRQTGFAMSTITKYVRMTASDWATTAPGFESWLASQPMEEGEESDQE